MGAEAEGEVDSVLVFIRDEVEGVRLGCRWEEVEG